MLDARLLYLIKANPGITYARSYASITADKSIRPGYFRFHLRQLIRSGKIVKIQDGSFWPQGIEPKVIPTQPKIIPSQYCAKHIVAPAPKDDPTHQPAKVWMASGFIREPSRDRLMAGR
jgi:hypothetical protein